MIDIPPKRITEPERNAASRLSLKERFERFMSSGGFAENIDALTIANHVRGRKKADYLAHGRSIIIEQKSIDRDVDAKVQAFLNDFVRQHGPLDAEQITLARIINAVVKRPTPNPFKSRLRAILTQRIDDYLAEADKQTRDTRLIFSIPEAIGVVVLLNEYAPLIEPDYFMDKAWDMFRKESAPGLLRYPANQVALLISEAHRIPSNDSSEIIPTETTYSTAGAKNPIALSFVNEFWERWAAFNGAGARQWPGPIRDVTTRDPATLFKTR